MLRISEGGSGEGGAAGNCGCTESEENVHLVVNLLLSDRARALAHLLLHLVCGRLILLLQLLLLLAILQYSLTVSEQIYVSYNRTSCVGNVLHTETCSWQVTL